MESIYENGGFIGATLDFGSNEVYGLDRELNLSLTRTESIGAFATYSSIERTQNIVFSCEVTFPFPAADGQLFKMGGATIGCWVGLRDSGTKFRVRAGAGGALSASSTNCALLDITDFPTDGNSHIVTWDFTINPGRVRLWIDGVFKAESSTTGGEALVSDSWAGTNDGAYINVATQTGPTGEPATAWQGTNVGSGLRVFTNQLVTNDGTGARKISGIWNLKAAYSASDPKFVVAAVYTNSEETMTAPLTISLNETYTDGTLIVLASGDHQATAAQGTSYPIVRINNSSGSGLTLRQFIEGDGTGLAYSYIGTIDLATSCNAIYFGNMVSQETAITVIHTRNVPTILGSTGAYANNVDGTGTLTLSALTGSNVWLFGTAGSDAGGGYGNINETQEWKTLAYAGINQEGIVNNHKLGYVTNASATYTITSTGTTVANELCMALIALNIV